MIEKILPCLYRPQRDNQDRPASSCNTTSAVIVLEASNHPPAEIKNLSPGQQPEDALSIIADSPAALEYMSRTQPWFFRDGRPLVHPATAPLMLDWIVEQAYGRRLLQYTERLTLGAIAAQIDIGRAVVLRGQFTPQGHVVACIGYRMEGSTITELVLDDPWGDYMSGYANQNGERIALPAVTALDVLRFYGKPTKVGHLVVA